MLAFLLYMMLSEDVGFYIVPLGIAAMYGSVIFVRKSDNSRNRSRSNPENPDGEPQSSESKQPEHLKKEPNPRESTPPSPLPPPPIPFELLRQNPTSSSASSASTTSPASSAKTSATSAISDNFEGLEKLKEALESYKIPATVQSAVYAANFILYKIAPKPGSGFKMSAIMALSEDLARTLSVESINITPMPGESTIGIEVPKEKSQRQIVLLREILESRAFRSHPSKLSFALGQDVSGNAVVTDIAELPHLLIAGSTGSGKSVCINTLITSILYKATPEEVKLILIDPKKVELSVYKGIPHLLLPVITETDEVERALDYAVEEMERRYAAFEAAGNKRNLKGYNAFLKKQDEPIPPLPQILIIIDEMADLMITQRTKKDGKDNKTETNIVRLAQKARAAGIHLVLATQRPVAEVIKGTIKSNVLGRIAFAVGSALDSNIILDSTGAEKLLGKGDMFFIGENRGRPKRIQGAFISDDEVEEVVEFLKNKEVYFEKDLKF